MTEERCGSSKDPKPRSSEAPIGWKWTKQCVPGFLETVGRGCLVPALVGFRAQRDCISAWRVVVSYRHGAPRRTVLGLANDRRVWSGNVNWGGQG